MRQSYRRLARVVSPLLEKSATTRLVEASEEAHRERLRLARVEGVTAADCLTVGICEGGALEWLRERGLPPFPVPIDQLTPFVEEEPRVTAAIQAAQARIAALPVASGW